MVESLKRKPHSSSYLKGVGKLLLQQDPLGAQAEQLLTKIQRAMPADPEARYLYSQWAYLNNKHQLCIDELNNALVLPGANDQTRMQIYALMGLAEDGLNNPEAAETAFRKSLEFNRKLRAPSPFAALRYIEFLVKRSRDREAQQVIDDVLTWSPTFGPARFERVKFLAGQRQLEKAIEEAKLVLQHSANDQDQLRAAHAFLAKTYFALGRVKDAQTHQSWIEAQSRPQP